MLNLLVTSLMPYTTFAAPVMAWLPSRYKHCQCSQLGAWLFSPDVKSLAQSHEDLEAAPLACKGEEHGRSEPGSVFQRDFSTFLPLLSYVPRVKVGVFSVSNPLSSNPLCFGESLVMLMGCLACLEGWSVTLRNTCLQGFEVKSLCLGSSWSFTRAWQAGTEPGPAPSPSTVAAWQDKAELEESHLFKITILIFVGAFFWLPRAQSWLS